MIDMYEIPRNQIIGEMRRIFARGSLCKEARARQLSKKKGPRGGSMWDCEECGEAANAKNTAVDHIETVCPIDKSYDDMTLDEIACRMWCKQFENPLDNLQLLCKTCHDKKTATEQQERKQRRWEKEMSRKAGTAAKKLPDSVGKEDILPLFEDLGEDIVKKLTGDQLGDFIFKTVNWYRGRK